jgi:hypothetical protein
MKYLIIAVMAAALSTMSYAALTQYEGFDYTVGSELVGSAGGTGWTGPWSSTQTEPSNTFTIGTDLSYTDGGAKTLITSGGSFLFTKSSGPANCGVPRPLTAHTSGEIYVSALIKQLGDGNYDYFLQLINGSETCSILVRGSWPSYFWRIDSSLTTLASPVTDETQFLVARVDLDTSAIDLWVNPDLVTPGAAGYSGTCSLTGLDTVQFFVKNEAASENYAWDEIRVGTTYADVTPYIPEPAFGIFALLGALVLRLRK